MHCMAANLGHIWDNDYVKLVTEGFEELADVHGFAFRANRPAYGKSCFEEALYDPDRNVSICACDENFTSSNGWHVW